MHDPPSARAATARAERVSQTGRQTGFRKRLQRGRPRIDVQRPINDLGDSMRRHIEHVLVGGSAGCHGQRRYPARSTERASRLDDVAPDLAQHLAHVAEPIPGPTEQLRSLTEVHRGVVRHSGDRKLELTDLLGDCVERTEVDLRLARSMYECSRRPFSSGP